MLGRHVLLGGLATAGLGWRMVDPKGSYAALYDTSHFLTEFLSGYEVLARFLSLVLVDQFNGLMLGIAVGTLLHLALGGCKAVMLWPFARWRKRRAGREAAVPAE